MMCSRGEYQARAFSCLEPNHRSTCRRAAGSSSASSRSAASRASSGFSSLSGQRSAATAGRLAAEEFDAARVFERNLEAVAVL
jgi:hypothetical protein